MEKRRKIVQVVTTLPAGLTKDKERLGTGLRAERKD